MNTRGWTTAMVIGLTGMTWMLAGCGSGEANGMETTVPPTEDAVLDDGGGMARSSFVEREFWLALSEEPTWHLNQAREEFLAGENQQASQDMAKVAAILNFESRHAHSAREEGLLLASVQELREVSRQLRVKETPSDPLPSLTEVNRVEALVLRTIAAHQVTLARDALAEGDGRMAGRYIAETANALEAGFERSGIPLGAVLPKKLEQAKEVASRMEMNGNGSRDEGLASLDQLDAAVAELGDVVTGGRK